MDLIYGNINGSILIVMFSETVNIFEEQISTVSFSTLKD